MWISRYMTANSFSDERPSVGEVRATGEKVSVSAASEHLTMPMAAPYGISYVPPLGVNSVILPTAAGDVCVGVIADAGSELAAGELMLRSKGGASIVLKNDGRVLINGRAVE